jgi:hypothetical protein
MQFNALLVIVDKYLPEIETRFAAGWKSALLEREGRRLWLTLAPLALVPVRVLAGDKIAWWAAGAIVAAIVIPDLYRLALSLVTGVGNLFKVTPQQGPATYIVLP